MKKAIIGVMVAFVTMIVLGFQNIDKKYEYYDFKDNYGTSLNCNDDNEILTCLTKKGWIKVKQYSEVNNE